MLPFVGVDGEGGNHDGRHRYMMLRIGDHYTEGNWLRFILKSPKKRIHVSFFFDYDVTMMLRDMPEDNIRHLIQMGTCTYDGMQIHYRPRKEFTLKGYGTRTTINDVGTFFQSSFVKALDRWGIGTDVERKMIADGKEQRAEFGQLTEDTVLYNRMECRLLVDLMDKFRRACISIGYMPRMWQGPGQLAKAMLRKEGVPKTDDIPEPNLAGVWEAAQAAYFGGRFEISAVGPIKTPVDGWDINSAYPYATTQLPCLQHTTWHPSKEIRPTGLYRIHYSHPDQMWYTLPHRRKDGSICYPRRGSGWYWGVEILAAQNMGCQVTLRYGFEWRQNCNHRLFDFMHRLYSVRKAIGKSEAGIALKLAMNSVYGVTAQSVGTAPYANPVYAGLITAYTRAKLLSAMSYDMRAVYMVATDGLFCRADSLPLTSSSELGGWGHVSYPSGMFIVQPGVYFAGDKPPKTRGVPLTAVMRDRKPLTEAWHGNRDDSHTLQLRQFIGLRIAAHRNRLDMAGEWVDTEKKLSYDWTTKRNPDTLRHHNGVARLVPYTSVDEEESTPYGKIIGNVARENDRLEWADSPDWAERISEVL